MGTLETLGSPFVGLALAILGIVLAVYFYFRGRREKHPYFDLETVPLIGDVSTEFGELKVLFAGKEIPQFSSTTLFLWNQGRETIRGSDIAGLDPLQISCSGDVELLSSSVIGQTKPANGVTVTRLSDKMASITFDFLDHRDGAKILLLHSGTQDADLTVTGTIVGYGKITERVVSRLWQKEELLAFLLFMVSTFLGMEFYDWLPFAWYISGFLALIAWAAVLYWGVMFLQAKNRTVPVYIKKLTGSSKEADLKPDDASHKENV